MVGDFRSLRKTRTVGGESHTERVIKGSHGVIHRMQVCPAPANEHDSGPKPHKSYSACVKLAHAKQNIVSACFQAIF